MTTTSNRNQAKRALASAAEDPRVPWAAERTLLAWIRTGVSMMGFGFLVARFGLFLRELALTRVDAPPPQTGLSLWIGTALVLLGVVVNVLAAWQHAALMKEMFPEEARPARRAWLSIGVAAAMAITGLAMAAYLIALG